MESGNGVTSVVSRSAVHYLVQHLSILYYTIICVMVSVTQ